MSEPANFDCNRNVLFICQANICRSPMAEGVFRKLIRSGDFQQSWQINSAGTWTKNRCRVHPLTCQICSENGIDLSGHRSQEITEDLMRDADIILTMEIGQTESLRLEFPGQANKVFPLGILKGKNFDIADPVSGTEEDFRATYATIEGYLKGSETELLRLIQKANA